MSDHNYEAIEVPAPRLRRRPRGLLLDVATPIDLSPARPTDDGVRDFDPADRVVAGVQFHSDGCGGLQVVENQWCGDISLPEDYPDASCVGPFSSFWMQADDLSPARYPIGSVRERLDRRIDVWTSAELATRLLVSPDSPDLASEANVIVSTLTALNEAMFALDYLAADYGDTEFTFLSSPGLFGLMVNEHDLAQDNAETEGDPNGRPFRSATGHTFVGDAGIDGSIAPDGYETVDGGEWIWGVTGVHYWTSPVTELGDETSRLDLTRNRRMTNRGRYGLVAFDTCAVIAVQVEVPTIDIAGS